MHSLSLLTLPREFLAQVVAHIHLSESHICPQRTTDALQSLSLTHRTFTALCQARILREFSLTGSKKRMRRALSRFKTILIRRPEIANYVRRISFVRVAGDALWRWLAQQSSFVYITKQFTRLRRPPSELEFRGINFKFPYEVLYGLVKSVLAKMITGLTVTNCTNVPMGIFVVFPGLKRVAVDSLESICDIARMDGPPGGRMAHHGMQDQRSAPEELKYDASFHEFHELLKHRANASGCFGRWGALKVLKYSAGPNPGDIRDILSRNPLLEELRLVERSPTLYTGRMRDWVDLANHTHLRILALDLSVGKYREICVGEVAGVLASIPTANRLTEVALRFKMANDRPQALYLNQRWRQLADQIVRLSGHTVRPATIGDHWQMDIDESEMTDATMLDEEDVDVMMNGPPRSRMIVAEGEESRKPERLLKVDLGWEEVARRPWSSDVLQVGQPAYDVLERDIIGVLRHCPEILLHINLPQPNPSPLAQTAAPHKLRSATV